MLAENCVFMFRLIELVGLLYNFSSNLLWYYWPESTMTFGGFLQLDIWPIGSGSLHLEQLGGLAVWHIELWGWNFSKLEVLGVATSSCAFRQKGESPHYSEKAPVFKPGSVYWEDTADTIVFCSNLDFYSNLHLHFLPCNSLSSDFGIDSTSLIFSY